MSKIKVVTVHGGHNPQGKIACGASDYIDESKEDRIITKKVVALLKKNGIKAYNCTVNNGTSQTDVLKKFVQNAIPCREILIFLFTLTVLHTGARRIL